MVCFNYFIILCMKKIVREIAFHYKIDFSEKLVNQIKSHIKNGSNQIFLVVHILVIIDNFFRIIFCFFGKSQKYTKIIIKYRPPILSLLYKLISSLIILINFEKK